MRPRAAALLLAWTLTVTGVTLDQLRGEWIVRYEVRDDQGRVAVADGIVQVPAGIVPAELATKLQAILQGHRQAAQPPVTPGFQVTVP